ncbi:hypothetical protein LUZ62_024242 [Rhynchospora pubera]|uniref:ATP-dependent DNA helicase n=1 Tax=Rhynchospora pubera TaxID=906938 RepID=A0AAV8H8H2_9POAL|nr:hypothetical protein LUZ62_024242 [Rhynchospora pubera]
MFVFVPVPFYHLCFAALALCNRSILFLLNCIRQLFYWVFCCPICGLLFSLFLSWPMARKKRSRQSTDSLPEPSHVNDSSLPSHAIASASLPNTAHAGQLQRRGRGNRTRASVVAADAPLPQNAAFLVRPRLGPDPVLLDFGDPDQVCPDCHALYWSREKSGTTYTLCCRGGRVSLPTIEDPPEPLASLLDSSNGPDSVHFITAIRTYNSMFAFTSMGVRLDQHINRTAGPYVFRISSQVCHRIGSLTPPEGQRPSYAQLYFYDTANEVRNRIAAVSTDSATNAPREHIVLQISHMLYQHNTIAQGFRSARERLGTRSDDQFSIRISSSRRQHGVQYSAPAVHEVVGLVVGDFEENHPSRDVIIECRNGQLQRINPLHKKYFALQYPLIFTRGEDSYTEDIEYDTSAVGSSDIQRPHVTMLEYYRYRLHVRDNEGRSLFKCGRLFQQICVDMYACIEDARLSYLYHHHDSLRVDTMQNIKNAVLQGDMFGHQIGKRFILPTSFVGGPRYLFQNYQDALALCRTLGLPHLFITFTCNPAWAEIRRNLFASQLPSDRPDLVCRVFKMKLDEMIKDIRERNCFGAVSALIYTVEFQKRGLPHVHIVVWLADRTVVSNPSGVDSIISVELPDPAIDPEGYAVVSRFMVHGPCGKMRPTSPCMEDGKCKKYFPKEFVESTVLTHDDFVQYRRRDLGITDHILYELEDMLISRGRSLEFVKLPQPTEQRIYEGNSTLIAQQLSYNTVQLRERVPGLLSSLTDEQRDILQKIIVSVQNKQGKQFFVYGPGGTGKTHLWTALTAKLRSEGKIVLTVASSGLSSLLLQGGVTAYSRFKIPIELTEKSTCDIKKNSQLARLILGSSLIIWDEAPMSHRLCFEALDRTMRDLFASRDPALAHCAFGGMTVVLGGDFRQTLPVITHGTRYHTVAASIVHSHLWDRFTILYLTQNMRLMRCRDNPAHAARIAEFSSWFLAVGDGQKKP